MWVDSRLFDWREIDFLLALRRVIVRKVRNFFLHHLISIILRFPAMPLTFHLVSAEYVASEFKRHTLSLRDIVSFMNKQYPESLTGIRFSSTVLFGGHNHINCQSRPE
jgi:hypothetical protein